MVKFFKQFEGQLVPEWKEAFVDYWQLKKDLKKIHLLNNNGSTNNVNNANKESSFSRTFYTSLRKFPLFGPQRRQHGVIQVLDHPLSFRTFFFLFPKLFS